MKKESKTALVLEGGAMRGIYTAGVLDILLKNNIKVDAVIGVSAGAIHGCSYVSEQYKRSINYYKECRKDYRFMSFKSFFKTGNIVDTEYCYHEIPDVIFPFDHDTFEKSSTKFYVTVTNIETGEPEYIHLKSLRKENIDYLRASASMPVVSQIVEIGGKKYLDGGMSDSIPIEYFRSIGYDKCIIVKTKDKSFKKTKEKIFPIAKKMYKDYPKFVEKLKNRHIDYNNQISEIRELEKEGKVLVIEPSRKLKISRLEKKIENVEEAYNQGRIDASNKLKYIKKFLKK
jgi:predicted patatin/cPLA2 family phospholipase